ncbi:Protein bem46 [Psilocybe cubensis]|uniref:Protein bem46 n=2 Tax=Psilocybe cubensis TaxID=181762 RepID=A0ACB8GZG3_PSICU|nr:Protein bem46 [Psilocybe cubensis]KAH9481011.1 Protein bem46 [Psilocybe cubensis]
MSTILSILKSSFSLNLLRFVWNVQDVCSPGMYRMCHEDVVLITKDKMKLHCFLVGGIPELESAKGTVIIFHGNAMNYGDMLDHAKVFYDHMVATLLVEYRGYGHNKGVPSEKGLCLDAQAAVDYVTSHPILSKLPIIIYGQSLGGAVAIEAASKNHDKISALIIENTFISIAEFINGFPIIRHLSWMCTQKWKSSAKLSRLPTSLPILMLSGRFDRVIDPSHMDELWKVAMTRGRPESKNGQPNEEYQPPTKDMFQEFPYGRHTSTYLEDNYWETIIKFLENVLEIQIPDVDEDEDED